MAKNPPLTGVPGKWTLRYLDETDEERSTCGHRHRLLSDGDGTRAFAHLVRIYDSTPHYHKEATELYYVLEGKGLIALDGEDVPLRPGACLEVLPGVVHAARGDVLVLVVGIPNISDADTYFPDPVGSERRSPEDSSARRDARPGGGDRSGTGS